MRRLHYVENRYRASLFLAWEDEVRGAMAAYSKLFTPELDATVYWDEGLNSYFLGDPNFNLAQYWSRAFVPRGLQDETAPAWVVFDTERDDRFAVLGSGDLVYDEIGRYVEQFGNPKGGIVTLGAVTRWYRYDSEEKEDVKRFNFFQALRLPVLRM